MPHITIEYSANLAGLTDIDALVAAYHEGLPAADVSRVEVRAAADRLGDLAPGFHQAPGA